MSSATAGPSTLPSNSSSSAPLPPPPAHPAFPSLIPRALQPKPAFDPHEPNAKLPANKADLLTLLQTYSHPHDAVAIVIPTLLVMTRRKAGKDRNHQEKDEQAGEGDADGDAHGDGKGKGKSRGGPGSMLSNEVNLKAEKLLAGLSPDFSKLGAEDYQSRGGIYLFILTAFLQLPDQNIKNTDYIDVSQHIIALSSVDQLRACGPRLSLLAWYLIEVGRQTKRLSQVLDLLDMLIRKTVRTGELSGVSAAFLQGCLYARDFERARHFINGVYIDVRATQPTYRDVLAFFHHAGLISAALGDFERALEMFSTCVTLPTQTASAIQLAAAKRAYLCGLLYNGVLPRFPKYVSTAVSRFFDQNLAAYEELGQAYMASDWAKIGNANGVKIFREDNNIGLIEQIILSVPAQQVRAISRTISTLRLSDLIQRLGYEVDVASETAVLDLLVELNQTGKLYSSISQPGATGIVTFLQTSTDYSSPVALAKLKAQHGLSQYLDAEMRRAVKEAGVSERYLKKQMHQLDRKDASGTAGTGPGKGKGNTDFSSGNTGTGGQGGKIRGVGSNLGDAGF